MTRVEKNRFPNVNVFCNNNRYVPKTSFSSDVYVKSMNYYGNVSRHGNYRSYGANDNGRKRHANNWFGFYNDNYNYLMHAISKKTETKKRFPKKEKVIKQIITPNMRGPIFDWVPKSVCI